MPNDQISTYDNLNYDTLSTEHFSEWFTWQLQDFLPLNILNLLNNVTAARHTHADIFPGVVVGLGALGVITKLKLEIQPAFTVRQFVYEDLPLEELTENFNAIMSAGYTVSLFTDWQDRKVYQLWIKVWTLYLSVLSSPMKECGIWISHAKDMKGQNIMLKENLLLWK